MASDNKIRAKINMMTKELIDCHGLQFQITIITIIWHHASFTFVIDDIEIGLAYRNHCSNLKMHMILDFLYEHRLLATQAFNELLLQQNCHKRLVQAHQP